MLVCYTFSHSDVYSVIQTSEQPNRGGAGEGRRRGAGGGEDGGVGEGTDLGGAPAGRRRG